MDDGIIFLPKEIDIKTFENILQGLHPDIKFTLEEADSVSLRNLLYQMLAFLDINVILHETGKLETDVYYKPTNNHDYLDYHSQHASHVKDNIPFNLAKRIIVFCSNPETERYRLCELEQWLINCNYPVPIIKKAFKNARLQGPAPNKTNSNVLPFVTTNFCNFDSKNISQISSSLFQSSSNADVNSVFKDCRTVLALKQPPNLLRQLTKASFSSNPNANRREKLEPGLFKCSNNRCKLCKLYIQECKTFYTSNNVLWTIKSHISCNSKNVLYYLKCVCCNFQSTYTGKTVNLRLRSNNHISSCRLGNNDNVFDLHVFKCMKEHNIYCEPYFHIYAFMSVSKEELLLPYEKLLHKKSFDTFNCTS